MDFGIGDFTVSRCPGEAAPLPFPAGSVRLRFADAGSVTAWPFLPRGEP